MAAPSKQSVQKLNTTCDTSGNCPQVLCVHYGHKGKPQTAIRRQCTYVAADKRSRPAIVQRSRHNRYTLSQTAFTEQGPGKIDSYSAVQNSNPNKIRYTNSRHWSLCWATWNQSSPMSHLFRIHFNIILEQNEVSLLSQPVYLGSTLILYWNHMKPVHLIYHLFRIHFNIILEPHETSPPHIPFI
jgi:hypothetical protein